VVGSINVTTENTGRRIMKSMADESTERPLLLTVDEVATLLRTTRKAVYAMMERGLLPGVTRIGRRVLFRTDDLLDWLLQKSAPSPKEYRR
jgi:excisionase family DNA binding protein